MKGESAATRLLYDGIALALGPVREGKPDEEGSSDCVRRRRQQKPQPVWRTLLKRADRSGVLMYTIGLFDENSADKNPGVLKQLARQTGGLAYLP